MESSDKSMALERFLAGHAAFGPKPLYAPGTVVGDWKVLAFLGRGGSGEVYRVENVLLGTIGALKVLVRGDAKAKDRFRLEARLLSESACTAFPRLCAYGESVGRPYAVTELLEPIELPTEDKAVAKFVVKVCDGVAELHRLGYIHRDIKPSNIMLRASTGEPVLIDLGLVKASNDTPEGRNSTMSVVDGRAAGVGTPGYSAPEQFSGGAIAPTADIHALGVLVNACFKGKPPRCWARIVRQSTSSIPAQRYATVVQFVAAVRHRHRAGKFAAVVVFLSVAILGATFWMAGTIADGGAEKIPHSILDMRIPDSEARKIFQDTSSEEIDTNVQSVAWNELGETILTNGIKVTKIRLDYRTLKVEDPVALDGQQNVYIVGPGLLDADISGSAEVSIHIAKNAAFLNRTRIEYPESSMMYFLRGESYINFVNLKQPADKTICNIVAEDMSDVIVRFGGPLSYRKIREDKFRRMIDAQRERKERQRKSHDLRDAGITDELRGL